mmetsp:Transcript_26117/g.54851  ORF Transcript_26117/g.54851 Transcript_26117/m.54851 type:complete len:241 (-) Transcript_26117:479-1201(-)
MRSCRDLERITFVSLELEHAQIVVALVADEKGWKRRRDEVLEAWADASRLGKALARRVLDPHISATMTGDAASEVDQVVLRVHPVNHQVHRRAPFVAHIAGHLFAGEDARGVHAAGGAARGARAAMGKRVAVRRWLTFEAPPLHHSLEALALAHALHIDVLAGDEVTRGDARANGKHRVLRHSELAHVTLERKVELLEHARLGAIQALALLPTSPELQSEESLFVLELLLHDLHILNLDD